MDQTTTTALPLFELTISPNTPMSTIRVRDLTTGYSARKVVIRDLSWECGPGRIALLGPNGAGKSTLIKAMCGLLPIRRGSIELRGHDIDRVNVAGSLGYLPQDFGGTVSLSVRDLVQYCAWLSGLPRSATATGAKAALARVGLSASASRPSTSLSGGETRRLGVACAIAHDPPIVLLDEPTAGLDPVERDEIESLMTDLNANTVLATTHVVDSLSEVFDAVAVCRDGEILVSEPLGWFQHLSQADTVAQIDWRQVYRLVVADARDQ